MASLFTSDKAPIVNFDEFLQKAIKLSLKMVTMQPPMIVDTTEETFDKRVHEKACDLWNRELKEAPIYYLRPVLYFSYEGEVKQKGEVGNITPPDRKDEEVNHEE